MGRNERGGDRGKHYYSTIEIIDLDEMYYF